MPQASTCTCVTGDLACTGMSKDSLGRGVDLGHQGILDVVCCLSLGIQQQVGSVNLQTSYVPMPKHKHACAYHKLTHAVTIPGATAAEHCHLCGVFASKLYMISTRPCHLFGLCGSMTPNLAHQTLWASIANHKL